MIKNLVIVESPAKAKTIEKFLGDDYIVRSCFGHIRDLASDDKAVDVNNRFAPKYVVPEDKKKLVAELRKLSKEAEQIWLATDEDREGEAISWHLLDELNLDKDKIKRIVFHEITKPAILKAIANPRRIDENLVNAQQARRILDRLVGFELSPVLWRKVQRSLSAGRVQSVAVRVVVDREREVINHIYSSNFKLSAKFHPVENNGQKANAILEAELPERITNEIGAEQFLNECKVASYKITDIEVKPGQKSPGAPFTTSTLQQEASRKLGMSVTRTMMLAQKLYEAGHITYMRTDSVNLSETAIVDIANEVKSQYGEKYSHTRRFTTKNESAQEAHEAIRPTYINVHSTGADDSQRRLYELIWKRSIASQMSNAILEKTNVKISISTKPDKQLVATGEILKFDGFLKVYLEGKDDEDDEDIKGMLPPLAVGQDLDPIELRSTEKYNRPPARYAEASLVKKLEELGIGRPSTYAPTITTVQKRGYVNKTDHDGYERKVTHFFMMNDEITKSVETEHFGKERNKLFPTNIGIIVNDFLKEHFEDILDYNFTATVEKEFDQIAKGKMEWQSMLENFYHPFHKNIETTLETSERVKGERLLGEDPTTGKPVFAKVGRYGPMIQIGNLDEEEKPKYAKLRDGMLIETITMDEAMTLFKLPREVGEYDQQAIVVSIGRFGPYVMHAKEFYSLPKTEDPYTISLERSIEIIVTGKEAKAAKQIHTFEYDGKVLNVLNGRFGPYISYDKGNYKIPKTVEAKNLSQDEAIELVKQQIANPPVNKRKPTSKAAAEKKPAVKKPTAKKATTDKKPVAKKATTVKKKK
ncbi:MAG: type I DNA topoisomerase [Bacteroidota bacterium]|nr:type I DNA topoisomerase [Bacteroidota bacterium]